MVNIYEACLLQGSFRGWTFFRLSRDISDHAAYHEYSRIMRLLAIFAVVARVQADLSEYLDHSIRCRYIPENDRVVTFEATYDDPILYFQSQKLLEDVPFEAAKMLYLNSADGFVGVLKAVDGTDYHLVKAKIFKTFEFPSAGLWCGVSPGLVPGMFQGGRQKTFWLILLYQMVLNLHHDLVSLEGKMDQMERLLEEVGEPLMNCAKRLKKSIERNSVDFSEQDMQKCMAIYKSHQETRTVHENEESHKNGRKHDNEKKNKRRDQKRKTSGPSDKQFDLLLTLSELAKQREEIKEELHPKRGTDTILSLMMLAIWGLYYRSNSIVAQDMLSTMIIPYTATFIIPFLGPYGFYLDAMADFEVSVGQVEWIRRFSSGHGITHNVRQRSTLDVIIWVFRVFNCCAGAAIISFFHLGDIVLVKAIQHAGKNMILAIVASVLVSLLQILTILIYPKAWWVYLWKGYVNRSKIDSSCRTRYLLTLVIMTIRELPFVRKDREMAANLPHEVRKGLNLFIGAVIPFLVFYGLWANYEMAKRGPRQHEKDANLQNCDEPSATPEKDEVIGAKDEMVSATPDKVAENVTGALDGGSDEEAAKNVTALDEEPVLVDLVE